jgi:hypothetical protein
MHATSTERRSGIERRRRSVSAYWTGALNPRRRSGRRAADTFYPIVDWHSPRIFAWAMAILVLCVCDGVLTIVLLANGAVELNPIMAKFVPHSLGWFATIKLSLTSLGAMVLVVCSRMKLFRAIPGEVFMGLIFAGYLVLVLYELKLVERIH